VTSVLFTWALCATLLWVLAELGWAQERRERSLAERQRAELAEDILRTRKVLDIAAESQSVKVMRDESGRYRLRVVPRAEVREVAFTIGVTARESVPADPSLDTTRAPGVGS